LLNSVDADGTRTGFNEELLRAVREVTALPIIASGGAGSADHFPPAVAAGANAVLAASIFHEGSVTISAVKQALAHQGMKVRM
jgi:cyclase